jgi:hypothetical protein
MSKLMMALVGGCLSIAVAGAHAATGSPADSDKAGRMGPGTAAGQAGATDPTPGKAGTGTTGSAARSGTGASSTGTATTGAGTSTTTGASAGTSGASSAVTTDGPRTTRTRRAARASRG